MSLPKVNQTPIVGLFVVNLDLREDDRGWFKENYQRQKLIDAGLPDIGIVQNNISFNRDRGVTQGLHAEPWDKYISVANGIVFGAWVDLREGPGFGTKFSIEITPDTAIYVPRGVANGFQTLEEDVVYTYLVNEHWSEDAAYTFVNLFDEALAINWPIAKEDCIFSEKDSIHPRLVDVKPMEV